MKTWRRAEFWIPVTGVATCLTLIVACVALAWSNLTLWQAVVDKAASASDGIVGVFAATYGIPGWGWLLITLIVAGVAWRWIVSDQRAEALTAEIKGRDQRSTGPTVNFYDDFGVQVLYRVNVRPEGNGIEVIGIMCNGCKMHLQQQRVAFMPTWHCIRCKSVYPDVPAEVNDIGEHIRGSIIRGEIEPEISAPTGR